ncbi:MAG: hypothetical protein LBT75_04180 [Bacilli bacterium]|jgi:hypothetical protein|nr:hypothetical protein [Bacilli bacterium]
MKCLICNDEFNENSLLSAITFQQICNKCQELYIYHKKHVKLGKNRICVFYFAYYEVIKFYQKEISDDILINYLRKTKQIKDNTSLKEIVTHYKNTIFFKREELPIIIKHIKLLNQKNTKIIILYEIF